MLTQMQEQMQKADRADAGRIWAQALIARFFAPASSAFWPDVGCQQASASRNWQIGESEALSPTKTPKVGFVSLGCPKALTDSELILTQLSAGRLPKTSKTFQGADLVIVNTCGFIDDAVNESLDTIGEALAENGKVIVTGGLGARAGENGGNLVKEVHPSRARPHRPTRHP